MKKTISLLTFLLMFVSTQAIAKKTYRVDTVHSSVSFKLRHFFTKFTGHFKKFNGTITFDKNKPAATKIKAEVSVASVDTNNKKRDGHLRTPDYFDAKTHPKMTFVSTVVVPKGKVMLVQGKLTIRGKTKRVTMELKALGEGKDKWGGYRAGFRGKITIDRTAFGVGKKSLVLGSKVTIILDIAAVSKK